MLALLGWLASSKVGRYVIACILVALVLCGAYLGFRVWLAAHDASIRSLAEAKCTAEKTAMVSKAEYDAMQAIAERNRKDAEAAAIAATEAQRRASAAKQIQQAAEQRITALEAEAAQNKALSTVTQEDLKWSAAHH